MKTEDQIQQNFVLYYNGKKTLTEARSMKQLEAMSKFAVVAQDERLLTHGVDWVGGNCNVIP